jgi:hypothetical protein
VRNWTPGFSEREIGLLYCIEMQERGLEWPLIGDTMRLESRRQEGLSQITQGVISRDKGLKLYQI